MLNDGKIVTLTGAKSKSLKTPGGSVLAKVSKVTYEVNCCDDPYKAPFTICNLNWLSK